MTVAVRVAGLWGDPHQGSAARPRPGKGVRSSLRDGSTVRRLRDRCGRVVARAPFRGKEEPRMNGQGSVFGTRMLGGGLIAALAAAALFPWLCSQVAAQSCQPCTTTAVLDEGGWRPAQPVAVQPAAYVGGAGGAVSASDCEWRPASADACVPASQGVCVSAWRPVAVVQRVRVRRWCRPVGITWLPHRVREPVRSAHLTTMAIRPVTMSAHPGRPLVRSHRPVRLPVRQPIRTRTWCIGPRCRGLCCPAEAGPTVR